MAFTHRITGDDPKSTHPHDTVAEAWVCEDEAAQARDEARQMRDEMWAEDAWLRAAEAGTPDTWREEDLERMSEAYGLPVPPGMY